MPFAPRAAIAAVCVALLLVACRQHEPTAQQVRAEADKLTRPLPGRYRSTTTLLSFDLPGADRQTEAMIRRRFASVMPQQRELCLSPEAAARGFEDLVRQTQQGACRIERFAASGGRLSARMRCRLPAQSVSLVTVEGTGGPSRSRVDLAIEQTGPTVPGGTEEIALRVDNVRMGDCRN